MISPPVEFAVDAVEDAVVFRNARGQRLVGVWHEAARESGAQSTLSARAGQSTLLESHRQSTLSATIVMLHGWSGTRSGPHQMLTRAARRLAREGFNVLRFDFAGRGDSDGDTSSATLATMADDTRAALDWCRSRSDKIILLGLCSGCEVAVAMADEAGVRALALWSAPVFAAAQSDQRRARKRFHHLQQYARKLLRPTTYAKLLSGRVDTRAVRAAISGSGGEAKNIEADADSDSSNLGQLPSGWRARSLRRFQNARAPLLLIYGSADPTTIEARDWHQKHYRGALETHLVDGANHSYYGLAWEREVIEHTAHWLRKVL